MTDERKDQLTAEADGLIEGRNAVIEALRTEASIDKIFIQKGEVDKTLGHIASKARAAGIVVVEADRRNLGAIIRTAYCAGAHGVVIPKRRSAGLTSVVAKTSAGAVSHMKVARVPNIPSLLKDLKKQGVWVFGTAVNGTTGLYDADLKGAAAIVIGSEGDGMTRLAAENCDFLVSIPMKGDLNSLNASASAAILLYEAVRQRMN